MSGKGSYSHLTPSARKRTVALRKQSRAECRDTTVGTSGNARRHRTDLGIALLHAIAIPGVCYTREEIAAWAGTTDAAIYGIELRAMRKLRNHLMFREKSIRELFAALVERRQAAQRRIFQ